MAWGVSTVNSWYKNESRPGGAELAVLAARVLGASPRRSMTPGSDEGISERMASTTSAMLNGSSSTRSTWSTTTLAAWAVAAMATTGTAGISTRRRDSASAPPSGSSRSSITASHHSKEARASS
jgi:hypothetical protein